MKLINHHKDNYTYDDTHSGSVMGGTIYMTEAEWDNAVHFLAQTLARATSSKKTYTRDALMHVFNWTLHNHAGLKRLCLGVEATRLIAEKYGLKRYKHQNYVIERI